MKRLLPYLLIILWMISSTGCRFHKKVVTDPPKAIAVNPATGQSPKTVEEQLMLTKRQKRRKERAYFKDKLKEERRHQREVKKYLKQKNSAYSRWLIKKNRKHARKYNNRFGRRRFFLWRWLGW